MSRWLRFVFLFQIPLQLLFASFDPTVTIFPTQQEVGEAAARRIVELIVQRQKEGRSVVLGFATGSTVLPVYAALKKIVKENKMDLSHVTTFNLDEYVGLGADDPQSFHSFMFEHLFNELLYSSDNPRGIRRENIHIPEGRDDRLVAQEYEALIARFGPIDLQILGIGTNGHIGFAEPGTSFSTRTMRIHLTENTRRDNARFFEGHLDAVPEKAITMGIATILEAKEILLLATGEKKASVIAKALKAGISSSVPASSLRLHKNARIFLDERAAFRLSVSDKPVVKKFYNARVLLDHKIQKGELWVSEGKIIAPQEKPDLAIDVQEALLAPGFIDLQINGGFGCDFSQEPDRIAQVAKRLPHYGVTSFLPTIISCQKEQYRAILPLLQPRTFGNTGAAILGIHLEGPFFSSVYCGAHDKHCLLSGYDLANSSIEEIYGNLQGVKMVTLAPEIPGALELIKRLRQENIVVAAGHSNATFEEMQAGIEAGVSFVTHLFNAMPSYHHRNPGVVGAALIRPALPYSLIADGIHLCSETISLCWRCNPEGLILVTDSTAALGLPSGTYKLGTMEIEVSNGCVHLAGSKTIAGSALSLDQAVRHLRAVTECSVVQALEAASLKPAELLHLYPAKGTLEVGADADFLILTTDLYVKAAYLGGELYEGN
jgi:N-acetylglucosamine-6-phosphate deacetylase